VKLPERRHPFIVIVVAVTVLLPLLLSGLSRAVFAAPILRNAHLLENGPASSTAGSIDDSGCKAVFEANDKLLATPNHMFMTHTSAAKAGKSTNSEVVTVGGVRYIMVGGKWTRSSMSMQERKDQEEQNRKNAKTYSCHYVREESVSGEDAVVYSQHSETEDAKSDGLIWISKSKGLILRIEMDLDTGGELGKDHMSIRFDYSNVKAPRI
jgi:hypothetical protein